MRQMAEIALRAAADSLADCVDCAYAVLTHAAWEESKKGKGERGGRYGNARCEAPLDYRESPSPSSEIQ